MPPAYLTPTDVAAIGLAALGVVQVCKLFGMDSAWAPPLVILIGALLGVAAGFSAGVAYMHWLPLGYEGAIGGLSGAGIYSIGGAMKNTTVSPRRLHRTKGPKA